MLHVVICDPPSAHRPTLAHRVASVPGVERVDVVDDVGALRALLSRRAADVLLVGSRIGQAASAPALLQIHQQVPGLLMIMLTMGTDPDDVVAGMDAGAIGYLARDAALAEVAAAMALLPVDHGRGQPVGTAQAERASSISAMDEENLTDRELQVLGGMSRGRSNSEIGEELFLSEDTIKTHARRLFRKMHVNDRAHAVAEGFRRGLLG